MGKSRGEIPLIFKGRSLRKGKFRLEGEEEERYCIGSLWARVGGKYH
jgi:hypothetical protein